MGSWQFRPRLVCVSYGLNMTTQFSGRKARVSPNKEKIHMYSREERGTIGKDFPKINMETNEPKAFLLKPEVPRTSNNTSPPFFFQCYPMEIVVQSIEKQSMLGRALVPKVLSKERMAKMHHIIPFLAISSAD